MKLSARILAVIPLVLVTIFYAFVSRQIVSAALMGAALLGAIALGGRLVLPITAQRILALALAGAAIALTISSATPLLEDVRALKRPWGGATLAALSIATFRLYLRAPERGPIITFAFGLIALMTVGETNAGPIYGVLVIAYLGAALLALRAQDRGRPPLRTLSRRDWAFASVVLALTSLTGAALARVLPPLSDWSTSRMLRALGDSAQTGFSDRMWLGAMEGMLQSSEVVMRIDGAGADYLRGAVFDHYERGRWSSAKPLKASPWPGGAIPNGARAVQVTLVGGARDRYFLPLGAARVAALEGVTTIDGFGILHTQPTSALGVWFEPEGTRAIALDEPNEEDLQIPPSIQIALSRLAATWTAGAPTPRAKVEAIAARLRSTYGYSLRFESHRRDPVLNFLLDVKKGHCEYFASGLSLLARAEGVPSRVVIGYRVSEKNTLGDYYIVREKNAHAWVEVYLPNEGWTTFDATPLSELTQAVAPHGLFQRVGDFAAFLWAKTRVAWAQISLLQIIGALVVVILLGLIARWFRRRGLGAGQRKQIFADNEPPPAGVQRLFDALEQRGLKRDNAEPIERFARRIEEGSLPEAAHLLQRYAAFRYGGIGEGEPLLREVEGYVERIRRT